MSNLRYFNIGSGVLLQMWALLGTASSASGFTLDGIRNLAEESGYEVRAQQSNTSAGNNVLTNLHTAVTDANLRVFVGGQVDNGNAMLLFIDSKPGGVPVDTTGPYVPNDLISSGDLPEAINNLGASPTAGMRFESGFQPDYAIRIQGNGIFQAQVHRYDLAAGTGHALGNAADTTLSGGFISGVHVRWQNVAAGTNYSDVVHGMEMSLNLPLMGATAGTHAIRMMAVMVNADSTVAFNQTLGSLAPESGGIGAISSFDFETEPGIQTIAFSVTFAVTDSDGDGLPDEYETNDGIYLSATATGSDPLVADTDGDGLSDNDEVLGNTPFGYVTNPNVPNYENVWAPGNFTSPQFQVGPETMMTRAGTGLTEQYQWSLLFRITSPQNVNFKLTAGGDPAVNWGPDTAPGSVLPGSSNNFSASAPATGFYQIDFDQTALTWSFARKEFPTLQEYLDAYGVVAGVDDDGDGILNENEYAANTDPTNADSDGDGLDDAIDPDPLRVLRDIVFSVDMSLQQDLGTFDPATDQVKVRFFDSLAPTGELALVQQGGGIYTGTLADVPGTAGLAFGTYQFALVPSGGGDIFLEDQFRNFDLGAAHVDQVLDVIVFNDFGDTGTVGYENWTETWARDFDLLIGGPSRDLDGDGFTNYEEYLFGTLPHVPDASLVRITTSGDQFIIFYNEQENFDINMDILQSPDLSAGSWDFADVEFFDIAFDQSGVAPGYNRVEVRVPMSGPRMFLRAMASEGE